MVVEMQLLHKTKTQMKNNTLKWLCSDDLGRVHRIKTEEHTRGTFDWFIQSEEFTEWRSGDIQLLVCHGLPLAGKSVMMYVRYFFF